MPRSVCALPSGRGRRSSGSGYGQFDRPGGSIDEWQSGYWMVSIGYGMLAVSAICGALYVRKITRALSNGSAQRGNELRTASTAQAA